MNPNTEFSYEEMYDLKKASRQLRRWYERNCNEDIQEGKFFRTQVPGSYPAGKRWFLPDADAKDAKTYTVVDGRYYQTPNMERGAIRRIKRIVSNHPGWEFYLQTDPRGTALYLYRHVDVPAGAKIGSCYSTCGTGVE